MTAQPSHGTAPSDVLTEGLFQVQHQALLRTLLNGISEGVIIADASGHLLYFSPYAHKLLGMGVTDAAPADWSARYGIFQADTRTPCPFERLPLYRALQGEERAEEEFFVRNPHVPDGQHLHASASPVRDEQGQLLGAIVTLRNTQGERHAEASRRRTEQQFQLIVEAAQEGIWTIDTEKRTTYVNRYLAEMLGYTVDDMMGQPIHAFMDEESRAIADRNLEKRRRGISEVHDFKFRHKEGRPVWTMMSSNPLYDEQGRYNGALTMVADVTRRRTAEEEVRQLNARLEQRIAERTAQFEYSNRELESFAYSVAHDLRAPLRSISNFTQALAEDCGDQLDSIGHGYLGRMRAAAMRMSELIDGILALSRVNRTGLLEAEVNLSALAHSVSEQIQRWQPERSVRFLIQDGLVDRGDAQLLRGVLENLVGNAWKFTRERPQAEIEFGSTLAEDGKRRVYFVRDNGAGFDMAFRNKLFGVFQRLHTQQEFEGNGVGLATVQRILRRHGGSIWGEGRVGHGATFFFSLHDPTPTPPNSEPGPII